MTSSVSPRPLLFGQVGFLFHIDLSADEFRRRLRNALDIIPLDALLAGWDGPSDRWQICAEEAARRGVPLYLWQPLLSNLPADFERMGTIGLDGRPGGSYISPSLRGPAGHFQFVCPNHPETPALVLGVVEDGLRATNAAGLFLDKIRYPSPAAGLEASLSCFCRHCRSAALAEELDLAAVRVRLRDALRQSPSAAGLSALGLAGLVSDDPLIARWHRFRSRSITRIVASAADVARHRNCSVGLDLFAPFFGGLVGQDYAALPALADWIKPMLYCRSVIPSGLPIEIDGLIRGLPAGARALMGERLGHAVPDEEQLLAEGLPLELAADQAVAAQGLAGSVPSLAGIEVANRPGICRIDPATTARYGRILRARGVAGIVASPDILLASPDNLKALAHAFL